MLRLTFVFFCWLLFFTCCELSYQKVLLYSSCVILRRACFVTPFADCLAEPEKNLYRLQSFTPFLRVENNFSSFLIPTVCLLLNAYFCMVKEWFWKKTYTCFQRAWLSTAWASIHKTLQLACFPFLLWILRWQVHSSCCTTGAELGSLKNRTAQQPTFSVVIL